MFNGIPLDWIRRQAAGVVREGLSLDTLLDDSTIVLRYGDNRDVVTPAQYLLLCMNTMLGVDDAAHGLATTSLGPLYPAIGLRMGLGCSNLEDALQTLCRLYSLASTAIHVQLRTDQETATLSVHVEARNDQDTAQLEETYLGWMFMSCRYFLNRALPVAEVVVQDPSHFNLGQRHWAIGGLVRYGNITAFRFSRRLLNEPLTSRSGSIALWECQRLWLADLSADPLKDAVADYTDGSQFVRFTDMARLSGMSPNTLRRQLRTSSGGFRQARQRALAEAAIDRLCETPESLDTIAAELGYSDGRSLRRFLKTSTGLTPQEIRTRHQFAQSTSGTPAMLKLQVLAERIDI